MIEKLKVFFKTIGIGCLIGYIVQFTNLSLQAISIFPDAFVHDFETVLLGIIFLGNSFGIIGIPFGVIGALIGRYWKKSWRGAWVGGLVGTLPIVAFFIYLTFFTHSGLKDCFLGC